MGLKSMEELINRNYGRLSETDLHIWHFIDRNRKKCMNMNIEDLSQACNVSRTTISRFAQKLSLNGFSELKVYLKLQSVEPKSPDEEVLTMVCDDCKKVIDEMQKRDCTDVCRTIYNAGRVFAYGSGAVQSTVARELQRMFLSIGETVTAFEGDKETERMLKHIRDNDVMILISLSGESEKIVSFAKELVAKNITIISITKLNKNRLASLSNYNIYMTSTFVTTGTSVNFETTTLYYIIIELLLVKYIIFRNKIK